MIFILIILDKHTEHQIWMLSLNMELEHILFQHLSALFALESFLSANLHMSINVALLDS